MDSKPFRPLSVSERLYLVGTKLAPPFAIQIIIEGSGPIDPHKLKKAIDKASLLNRGSRLILKGHLKYSYWMDSNSSPLLKIISNHSWDDSSLEEKTFLQGNINYRSGPTCEVLFVPGLINRIIFRCFHGVMDGKGALFWALEVFKAYNSKPLTSSTNSNITDYHFIKSFKTKDYRKTHYPDCISPTGAANGSFKNYSLRRLRIKGKHEGLISKIMFIVNNEISKHGGQKSRFMVPVDLRFHDNNLNTTANLSNPLFIEVSKDDTWTNIYQNIITKLRNKNELNVGKYDHLIHYFPLFILKYAFKYLSRWQYTNNRYMLSAIISHLGKIDLKLFKTHDFTPQAVYSLPLNIPITPLSIVTCEYDNFTDLTMSIPDCLASNGRMDQLVNEFENYFAVKNNFHPIIKAEIPQKRVEKLFEEQAIKTPHKVAIEYLDESISYKDLHLRSKALADLLQNKGLFNEEGVVAVMADRSIEMIIVILAIIKAGGTYLPIDPSYPLDRISYILEDSNCKFIFTEKKYKHLSKNFEAVYFLEDIKNFTTSNQSDLKSNNNTINDLIYLIYTSGSTGKPKGVLVGHKSVVNYLSFAKKTYLSADSNYLFPLYSSLSFDLTLTSLFLPLVTGNTIRIYKDDIHYLSFKKMVKENLINIIKLTPTHLKMLNDLDLNKSKIKKIIVGGEYFPSSLAQKTHNLLNGQVDIFNEYGPTEATIGCMIYKFDPSDCRYPSVLIGRPIRNTQIYILKENLDPVDIGEEGEVYISGECLSRGYLNNKVLTDKTFIKNPFIKNERMYQSGDLAKLGRNNQVEFIKRIDKQVKIRGHRIELGEIENLILEYPLIIDCSVNIYKGDIITAHFVANKKIAEDELRDYLLKKIPRYMIPVVIIQTDKIPSTVNGKVDSKELMKCLDLTNKSLKIQKWTNTPLANQLKNIWADVLLIEKCEIDEHVSFYEYGGDSLKFSFMVNRILETIIPKEEEHKLLEKLPQIIDNSSLINIFNIINNLIIRYQYQYPLL